MIDLHCHILPRTDDRAPDIAASLEMARGFVADGVSVITCTLHILPGFYHNTGEQIRIAVTGLQAVLDREENPLKLVPGPKTISRRTVRLDFTPERCWCWPVRPERLRWIDAHYSARKKGRRSGRVNADHRRLFRGGPSVLERDTGPSECSIADAPMFWQRMLT